MVFIQFRFTPKFMKNPIVSLDGKVPPFSSNHKAFKDEIIDPLIKHLDPEDWKVCYETEDKYGEPTAGHYHINIYTKIEIKKDTLQSWIRSTYKIYEIKGNACYSIKFTEDPEDEQRWWRYLYKQKPNCVYSDQFNIWKNITPIQAQMAQDERQLQIKRNRKARAKYEIKETFRQQMFAKMMDENLSQVKKIFVRIIKYYQDDNRTPPFTNLDNIVQDFLLYSQQITSEQYYDFTHQ